MGVPSSLPPSPLPIHPRPSQKPKTLPLLPPSLGKLIAKFFFSPLADSVGGKDEIYLIKRDFSLKASFPVSQVPPAALIVGLAS